MQAARPPILRGVLLLAALAAIAIIMARGDSPAQATTYNPQNNVSVSDPTPGAAADISINFSLNAPDAFPNVRTNSSIQFLPRSWGIHVPETEEEKAARIGAVAGTFNALTHLGVLGTSPCINPVPVPFTMLDANVDTSAVTSALDLGGDYHPTGLGYSGQFVDDPNTLTAPGDLGQTLVPFNANEMANAALGGGGFPFDATYSIAYRDVDSSGDVTVGDIRLYVGAGWGPYSVQKFPPAPSVVQDGDPEIVYSSFRTLRPFASYELHAETVSVNGQYDVGEIIYQDNDDSGTVSYGDTRLTAFGLAITNSEVKDSFLPGGVTRYPDFLKEMFPPEVVGEPLARQWGGRSVIGTPVSLNIVTFRPGQLPGYPATLGYPNVVVLLNPVAPIDVQMANLTNDLCTPLSLTSTNFGVSADNPGTNGDESGYVRLTNPKSEKSHSFTLVTTSQPDADDDGVENMLDSCPLTTNIEDTDGRNLGAYGGGPGNPDFDGIDGACDPDPGNGSPTGSWSERDEDEDFYSNRADNCSTTANGVEMLGVTWVQVQSGSLAFPLATLGDIIGPNNQLDTDGDDIGDACEGSETGAQCANDVDDDADGAVNDGCPNNPATFGESGAQCGNDVDDDGEGKVNDGCPGVSNAESGAQCSNAVDDDGDGKVNDGCTGVSNAESGAQCSNDLDDDGDGKVNDGCPRVGAASETVAQCANALDDDGDGVVNDGCARFPASNNESVAQCSNATDDDFDGVVNDGCAQFPATLKESGTQCSNATDDDFDGVVNDGCPLFIEVGVPEAACDDNLDDDADGLVNDGCPANDALGERFVITGHMHVVTLVQDVPIYKHGVKLNNLGGPKTIKDGGARTYSVDVSNLGSSAEDVQVGLRVVEGCAAVSGPSSVSVAADGSATASFTVDWTGCAAGTYTVQADACHAGDAAPAGLFGSGGCPGASDGMTDPNTLDDAPIAKSVEVGSP